MKWPDHGGQFHEYLNEIQQDEKILDFSVNINPFGPPIQMEEIIQASFDILGRYPDPSYRKLAEEIGQYEGLHSNEVLVTNGGAEAIFLVAQHFKGKKALIVQPTFIEYERACLQYNIQVEHVLLKKETFQWPFDEIVKKLKDVHCVFICRPNNPTGTLINKEEILALLIEAERFGTSIIIDEAFVHFIPDSERLTKWIHPFPNLILLRSLTKIYSLPGIRMGYCLSEKDTISALKSLQIPWSVNSLAAAIIPSLLEKKSFIQRTREWLTNELEWLQSRLKQLDFHVSNASTNFYLLKDPNHHSDHLFLFLAKNNIIARHTHNFKGLDGEYLRFAVRSREENEYLINVLKKWREEMG